MHRAGHKSEHVLDSAAGFGFLSVAFLLLIGQRLAAIPFFADTVFHMVGDFFADIGTVRIYNFIFFGKEISEFVAVMHICGCGRIIRNDFAVGIYLDMILISVMRFVVFLSPTGIGVLLSKLIGIFFSFLGCFSILYPVVFIAAVALTRRIHKSGINDCSGMRDDAFGCKHSIELCEKLTNYTTLRQCVTEQPDRFC